MLLNENTAVLSMHRCKEMKTNLHYSKTIYVHFYNITPPMVYSKPKRDIY